MQGKAPESERRQRVDDRVRNGGLHYQNAWEMGFPGLYQELSWQHYQCLVSYRRCHLIRRCYTFCWSVSVIALVKVIVGLHGCRAVSF